MTDKSWRKEAREICDRATKGPWCVIDAPGKTFHDHGYRIIGHSTNNRIIVGEKEKVLRVKDRRVHVKETHREADRQFIARTRSLLPRALDELDDLEPIVQDLTQEPCRKASALRPDDCGECLTCRARQLLKELHG